MLLNYCKGSQFVNSHWQIQHGAWRVAALAHPEEVRSSFKSLLRYNRAPLNPRLRPAKPAQCSSTISLYGAPLGLAAGHVPRANAFSEYSSIDRTMHTEHHPAQLQPQGSVLRSAAATSLCPLRSSNVQIPTMVWSWNPTPSMKTAKRIKISPASALRTVGLLIEDRAECRIGLLTFHCSSHFGLPIRPLKTD